MSLGHKLFTLAAGWYLLMGVGHQFYGSIAFEPVQALEATAIAQPEFFASIKGNYYSGGIWMLVSSIMHWSWGKLEHKTPEAKWSLSLMAFMQWALSFYYSQHGAPGIWQMVAITASLETACALLAWYA